MRKNRQKIMEERFRALAEDADRLFEYSRKPLRKSIRVNTLKTGKTKLITALESKGFRLEQIPWTKEGFWVEGEGLGDTLEHFLGHYYIQEASSMIPPLELAPECGDLVLDAAAAPGGKTTHMASLMENTGCILANEPDSRRIKALKFNLGKLGVLNTLTSSVDFSKKIDYKSRFDRILLDAPCSCEGQFRKNPQALEQWSLHKIHRCSGLQKKMIENALSLLKVDGLLVYSTCTLAPEENEEVVDYALKNFNLKVEEIITPGFRRRRGVAEWGGRSYSSEVGKCARIHPQDNDSEGFFLAKLKKCGH